MDDGELQANGLYPEHCILYTIAVVGREVPHRYLRYYSGYRKGKGTGRRWGTNNVFALV